jgi:hypothetical protein
MNDFGKTDSPESHRRTKMAKTARRPLNKPSPKPARGESLLPAEGAIPPRRATALLPPAPQGDYVGMTVEIAQSDYRNGDSVWLEKLAPKDFPTALNRDILVPRAAGRFAFGRLVGTEGKKLQLLPLEPGARQVVIGDAAWIGVVRILVRAL